MGKGVRRFGSSSLGRLHAFEAGSGHLRRRGHAHLGRSGGLAAAGEDAGEVPHIFLAPVRVACEGAFGRGCHPPAKQGILVLRCGKTSHARFGLRGGDEPGPRHRGRGAGDRALYRGSEPALSVQDALFPAGAGCFAERRSCDTVGAGIRGSARLCGPARGSRPTRRAFSVPSARMMRLARVRPGSPSGSPLRARRSSR
jgi:hypothetical protein